MHRLPAELALIHQHRPGVQHEWRLVPAHPVQPARAAVLCGDGQQSSQYGWPGAQRAVDWSDVSLGNSYTQQGAAGYRSEVGADPVRSGLDAGAHGGQLSAAGCRFLQPVVHSRTRRPGSLAGLGHDRDQRLRQCRWRHRAVHRRSARERRRPVGRQSLQHCGQHGQQHQCRLRPAGDGFHR